MDDGNNPDDEYFPSDDEDSISDQERPAGNEPDDEYFPSDDEDSISDHELPAGDNEDSISDDERPVGDEHSTSEVEPPIANDEPPIARGSRGLLNEQGVWCPVPQAHIGILDNPPPLDLLLQPATIRPAVTHEPDYTNAESDRREMDAIIGEALQGFTGEVSMEALEAAMTEVEAEGYPQADMGISSAQAYPAGMGEVPAQYFPTAMDVPIGGDEASASVVPAEYYPPTMGQMPMQDNPPPMRESAKSYLAAIVESPAQSYQTVGQMPKQSHQLSKQPSMGTMEAIGAIAAYFESRPAESPTENYPATSSLLTKSYLGPANVGQRFSTSTSTTSMSDPFWGASSSESIDSPSMAGTPLLGMGPPEPSQSQSASPYLAAFKHPPMPTFSPPDTWQLNQRRFSEPVAATQSWPGTMDTAQNDPAMDEPSMIEGYQNMGSAPVAPAPFSTSDFGITNATENSVERSIWPTRRNIMQPRRNTMDTVQNSSFAPMYTPLEPVTYGNLRTVSPTVDPSLVSDPEIMYTPKNNRKRSFSPESSDSMTTETRPAKRYANSAAQLDVADNARDILSAPPPISTFSAPSWTPDLANLPLSTEETIDFLHASNPTEDSDRGVLDASSFGCQLYHIASAPRDLSTASVIFPFSFWKNNALRYNNLSASNMTTLKNYLTTFNVLLTTRCPVFLPHLLITCETPHPSAQLPFQIAGLVAIWRMSGEPRPPGLVIGDAVMNRRSKRIPQQVADDLFQWRIPRMQTLRNFKGAFLSDGRYVGLSYISRYIVVDVPHKGQEGWAEIVHDGVGIARARGSSDFEVRYHNGKLTRPLPVSTIGAGFLRRQEMATMAVEGTNRRGEVARPTRLSLDNLQFRDQFVVRIENMEVPLSGLHRLQFEGKRYYELDGVWRWLGIFSVSDGLRRLTNMEKAALAGTPLIRLREVEGGGGYEETGEIGGFLGRQVLSVATPIMFEHVSESDKIDGSVLWFVEPAVEGDVGLGDKLSSKAA